MADLEYRDVIRRVIAKAWADADFRARLVADPAKILGAAGLPFKDDRRKWTVVEGEQEPPKSDTKDAYFHLPPAPFASELTDAQIDRISSLMLCTQRASACPSPMTTCCCDITIAPRLFD